MATNRSGARTGLAGWIDERTGVLSALSRLAYAPLVGGARLRHVLPGVLLYLFIQEAVLGLVMSIYFSPTATGAWASVAYFNDQVTSGWFVRGLHGYTSYALIVTGALYLALIAFTGGYRKPREVYWWSVLALALIIPATSITGTLLPWDEQSFGRMAVEFGIVRGVPGGEALGKLVMGGGDFGNLTTLRLYVLHALVLPFVILLLFWLHKKQVRRHGYWIAPPEPPARAAVGNYLSQWLLDVCAVAVVSGVLVYFTVHSHGIDLYAPAEVGSQFDARPAWYVRSLNELLKYFDGSLQLVGTLVIPGAVGAFFFALPWLDRAESPKFVRRLPVVIVSFAILAGYVVLTGMNFARDRHDEGLAKSMEQAVKLASRARTLATKGVLPAGGAAVYENDPQVAVRRLFKDECQNCHMIGGIGGDEAPDFTDYKSRDYLAALTRNVMDKRFFGGTKHKGAEGAMDLFPEADLSNDDLKAVTEFTFGLMGDVQFDKELSDKGAKVFDDQCSTCHEFKPGVKGDAPNLAGHGTKEWIAKVIKNSADPMLFGTLAQMPKYEGKLTEEQISQLADFLVQQRPGMAKPDGS
ncbi:MAG TPA: cytochrome b N-terminal domain-containing protein [Polyangiaceae bacterium]|nr:cytochrome b N-terminal domain-containing protein [Polyangiaceae bacterium]